MKQIEHISQSESNENIGIPLFQAHREVVYRVVDAGDESEPFTDELYRAIKSLWEDKGVRKAYDMRSEYQLNDSAK